jgi:hypothetical protein
MAKKKKVEEVIEEKEEKIEVLPRYVASIQDEKDQSCYKDFYESDKLDQAKLKAEQESKDVGRSVIIFDRKGMGIIDRYVIEQEKKPEPEKKLVKRGRK